MAKTNPSYRKLTAGYLFPEIARRTKTFQQVNPDANILHLGIGDTTEPLPKTIGAAMRKKVEALGTPAGYSGYGDYEGEKALRQAIAKTYPNISPSEVFVSDGAKSDSANIQSIFSPNSIIAIQDPAYPVYVDSNVIAGRTGNAKNGYYEGLVYMPCTEANGFFPSLPKTRVDLIYMCSPNNPTGAVATRGQLKKIVDYALSHKAIILFDAAYAAFIQDNALPRSIYEIEGATQCAIEINSFSKSAGFTGVRLGWSIIPHALTIENAEHGELNQFWTRRQSTFFNAASNIVQAGGLAALSNEGQKEIADLISFYMENACIIRDAVEKKNFVAFGGINAPYIWLKTPEGVASWEFFDQLLSECHVVGTPGAGFGPSGEGYFRLSAFGKRDNILEAATRIVERLT